MTQNEKPDALVKGFHEPITIDKLIANLQMMDPTTSVFHIVVGNREGMISWKRKENWKQWNRRLDKEKVNGSP